MSNEESYTGPGFNTAEEAVKAHLTIIELARRAGLDVVEVGTWSPAEQPEETLPDPE